MVSKAYLLEKPSPPSVAKLFLDQQVVPALINGVGAIEQGLERVAVAARATPLAALVVALGLGCLLRASLGSAKRR